MADENLPPPPRSPSLRSSSPAMRSASLPRSQRHVRTGTDGGCPDDNPAGSLALVPISRSAPPSTTNQGIQSRQQGHEFSLVLHESSEEKKHVFQSATPQRSRYRSSSRPSVTSRLPPASPEGSQSVLSGFTGISGMFDGVEDDGDFGDSPRSRLMRSSSNARSSIDRKPSSDPPPVLKTVDKGKKNDDDEEEKVEILGSFSFILNVGTLRISHSSRIFEVIRSHCLLPRLRCMECQEEVPLGESHALGKKAKQRRCKDCYNARRSLQQWHTKMGRAKEWELMDPEEKNKLVLEHKSKGGGKGRRRKINVEEKALCTDGVKLGNKAPFLTKKQLLGPMH